MQVVQVLAVFALFGLALGFGYEHAPGLLFTVTVLTLPCWLFGRRQGRRR